MKRTIDLWLDEGVRRGYCTEPVCGMHDGLPITDDELDGEFDDPCVPVVRLLEQP